MAALAPVGQTSHRLTVAQKVGIATGAAAVAVALVALVVYLVRHRRQQPAGDIELGVVRRPPQADDTEPGVIRQLGTADDSELAVVSRPTHRRGGGGILPDEVVFGEVNFGTSGSEADDPRLGVVRLLGATDDTEPGVIRQLGTADDSELAVVSRPTHRRGGGGILPDEVVFGEVNFGTSGSEGDSPARSDDSTRTFIVRGSPSSPGAESATTTVTDEEVELLRGYRLDPR